MDISTSATKTRDQIPRSALFLADFDGFLADNAPNKVSIHYGKF
jgi:hypothetical protein